MTMRRMLHKKGKKQTGAPRMFSKHPRGAVYSAVFFPSPPEPGRARFFQQTDGLWERFAGTAEKRRSQSMNGRP